MRCLKSTVSKDMSLTQSSTQCNLYLCFRDWRGVRFLLNFPNNSRGMLQVSDRLPEIINLFLESLSLTRLKSIKRLVFVSFVFSFLSFLLIFYSLSCWFGVLSFFFGRKECSSPSLLHSARTSLLSMFPWTSYFVIPPFFLWCHVWRRQRKTRLKKIGVWPLLVFLL